MNALWVETCTCCMLYMYFKETSLISHASLESSNKESINIMIVFEIWQQPGACPVLWISPNSWVAHRTTHGGKLGCPSRSCLFSKSSLAQIQVFWNSSICLYEIKRKNLFKSTCPTGSFTCPGPSGSGKRRALPSQFLGCPNYFDLSLKDICFLVINTKLAC